MSRRGVSDFERAGGGVSLPSELQDVLETAQTVKTGLYTIGLSSIFFLICIIVIFFFFLFRHAEGLAVKQMESAY